jgi:CheY-like chemotaxis protein
MSIAFFHFPGCVAVLDDDVAYLESLALAMSGNRQMAFYSRQQACIDRIRAERMAWYVLVQQKHSWINHWRAGRPLLAKILADSIASRPHYGLVKVLVVDYAMPGKNGLQVLQDLPSLTADRILLTGQADTQIAVAAFNSHLIEQYIPKQSDNIGQRITKAVDDMLLNVDIKKFDFWQAIFSAEQFAVLNQLSFDNQLHNLLKTRWVEYVVLSEPFGVFGFDAQGRAGWLQLETASSLKDTAEMAQEQQVPTEVVGQMLRGDILLALELKQALGLNKIELTSRAIRMDVDPPVYAAWFDLPESCARTSADGYANFMRTQSLRVIG